MSLGEVKLCALARAESRFEETCANGVEVASRRKLTCESLNISLIRLAPIRYLVEVVKPGFIEAGPAETQRSAERQSRRPVAVISERDVAGSEAKDTVSRGVVDVQTSERRLIRLRRIAKDRKSQRVVLINVPVNLAGVVICASTIRKRRTADKSYAGINRVQRVCFRPAHDVPFHTRIERSEEEQLVARSGHITTEVGADVVSLLM